jgi:hypothetical protein
MAAGLPDSISRSKTGSISERNRILQALKDTHGVVSGPEGAARRLGLKRTTLQTQMKRRKDKIKYNKLLAYTAEILKNMGYSQEQAEATSRILVEADARGIPRTVSPGSHFTKPISGTDTLSRKHNLRSFMKHQSHHHALLSLSGPHWRNVRMSNIEELSDSQFVNKKYKFIFLFLAVRF